MENTNIFELGGLLQDYNPETFKINSIDENGFDITKPGEYKVTFEMSYFMYANYTWFVEDTINVIDASSLEPGVYLTSSEPTLFFTNNDGMKGYAEFSKIDLSDNSYKISCVDGELKLAVTSSDDTVDINSFCTIADSDDNTKLLTINKAENDVPLIMYASRSDYESGKLFNGGGWKQPGMTEGQVDKVSDFEEYEEAVYNADVTDDDYMSVAGDYVLKGTFNTTCKGQVGSQTGNNHWGNGSTSPESNWATAYLKPSSTTGSFAASAKTRKQIIEFAAKYGANLKDSDFDTLKKAIFSVYSGETYIEPSLMPLLNSSLAERDVLKEKVSDLTRREMEVLKMIASGAFNKEIALTLNISERTVKNHVSNIFKKIGVSDRTQAAVFAIKNNIISIK